MKAQLLKRQDRWDLYLEDGSKVGSTAENPMNKLSLKNCEAIANGYDLDELADEHCNKLYHEGNINWERYRVHFKLGFQKAIEILGDKKFSEENLREAYSRGILGGDSVIDRYIKALQQTEWDVEIVIGTTNIRYDGGSYITANPKPKLDENGCLILKS